MIQLCLFKACCFASGANQLLRICRKTRIICTNFHTHVEQIKKSMVCSSKFARFKAKTTRKCQKPGVEHVFCVVCGILEPAQRVNHCYRDWFASRICRATFDTAPLWFLFHCSAINAIWTFIFELTKCSGAEILVSRRDARDLTAVNHIIDEAFKHLSQKRKTRACFTLLKPSSEDARPVICNVISCKRSLCRVEWPSM